MAITRALSVLGTLLGESVHAGIDSVRLQTGLLGAGSASEQPGVQCWGSGSGVVLPCWLGCQLWGLPSCACGYRNPICGIYKTHRRRSWQGFQPCSNPQVAGCWWFQEVWVNKLSRKPGGAEWDICCCVLCGSSGRRHRWPSVCWPFSCSLWALFAISVMGSSAGGLWDGPCRISVGEWGWDWDMTESLVGASAGGRWGLGILCHPLECVA